MNLSIRAVLVLGVSLIFVNPLSVDAQRVVPPDPDKPRPIDTLDTVFIEEMTWLEVRDAIQGGKTTVIVATGGVEQNGPYVVTGKHNYILEAITDVIARKLGNALVAPIIKFVPEGDHDPPSGSMRYPGTVSLREETFRNVLIDVCSSFKPHGVRNIVLLGDSGGNQEGMKEVAAKLNADWEGNPRVQYIPEYYDYPSVLKFVEDQGIEQDFEGIHDEYGISSILMAVDPELVRMEQRLEKGLFVINGVDMSPPEKTIRIGEEIIEMRSNQTVDAIRKAIEDADKGLTSEGVGILQLDSTPSGVE